MSFSYGFHVPSDTMSCGIVCEHGCFYATVVVRISCYDPGVLKTHNPDTHISRACHLCEYLFAHVRESYV